MLRTPLAGKRFITRPLHIISEFSRAYASQPNHTRSRTHTVCAFSTIAHGETRAGVAVSIKRTNPLTNTKVRT
ncbi:MAG: hypothetical protein ACF8MF_13270 [Phycisphaerales bacterium JB052]